MMWPITKMVVEFGRQRPEPVGHLGLVCGSRLTSCPAVPDRRVHRFHLCRLASRTIRVASARSAAPSLSMTVET